MKRPKKVSRNYKDYTKEKKVGFYQNIINEMSATASQFQKPPIAYPAIQTQLDKVEADMKIALSKAPGTAEEVDESMELLEVSIDALADYVDSIAQGDSLTIIASGFLTTSGTSASIPVAGMPVISHEYIAAAGEAGFEVVSQGEDVTYNFIISTDLSGLTRLGSFYVNNSVGATTFFGSSKQRKIVVTGLPSKVDLFIVCYATNTAGNSVISTVLPFSCK